MSAGHMFVDEALIKEGLSALVARPLVGVVAVLAVLQRAVHAAVQVQQAPPRDLLIELGICGQNGLVKEKSGFVKYYTEIRHTHQKLYSGIIT